MCCGALSWLATNGCATVTDTADQRVYRIMAIGDSITEGGAGFASYRYPLWEKLQASGYRVEFVGTRSSQLRGVTLRHEGYGGKSAEYLAVKAAKSFQEHPADVVLLHAGHNHTSEEKPVPGIVKATETLIASFRATNPRVIVLLAQVIPSGKLPKYSYIAELNGELDKLAGRLNTPSQPAVLVDQAEGFDWREDAVADKVHPNERGAGKMAAKWFAALASVLEKPAPSAQAQPSRRQLSGIYPHLAMFNDEGECGTGAVVPWAGRLWVVTYAPHMPKGSSDKLYEITPDLSQIVRPESIGGTPANRMIHRESQQLFIGPYVIDAKAKVRVIPYVKMFGRPTGNARHLTDPANLLYCASMEEGLYEVNVHSLEVAELWRDEQQSGGRHADLPGYHGKGLYSGQGVVVYANNGDHAAAARTNPAVPSGVLAEWDGTADAWNVVHRNQFTEISGPGGIYGNANPATDPLWTIGWDHRSLILMVRQDRRWHSFRLPKSSHSYDGAHGWNTEWPRIRDIGEDDLLMTMHGAFWRFPRTFSAGNTGGIRPRSNYLKVIGDFCRWNDRVVFGCDDTAKNEFLNKRKAKGDIAAPQSQSNLWFAESDRLDELGPVIGRGGLWVSEDVPANAISDPFLVGGFDHRGLHLAHAGKVAATIVVEIDPKGNGTWEKSRELVVPAGSYLWTEIQERAVWMRLSSPAPLTRATAWFQLASRDPRSERSAKLFDGLAGAGEARLTGGLVRARGENKRTLSMAALAPGANGPDPVGYYELDGDLVLRKVDDKAAHAFTLKGTRIPAGTLEVDSASVIFTSDDGKRWRLPKGDPAFDSEGPLGPSRVDREVATERDLFNAHGTFYELPAENAGGFAKVRPVATHNRRIHDYCSYRGLLIMTGIADNAGRGNPHIIRSADGKAALWAGAIDDVWNLGKPQGTGGPWAQTRVKAGDPSEPYLMTGYDRKSVQISQLSSGPAAITVEIDLDGTGLWVVYRTFVLQPGESIQHDFPPGFGAYWVRGRADHDTTATMIFNYR